MKAVVFDIGGVLLDWNPRHLYRKLFPDDEAAMERFLAEVCTQAWNERQDAGRPFAEAVAELAAARPEHAELIAAYHHRWGEMLAGAIEGTVAILQALKRRGMPLYALTNFASDKFALTRSRFAFLDQFDGIVVSGEIGLIKPDAAIFQHLIAQYSLEPPETLFIDDVERNVAAAAALGFDTVRFAGPAHLRDALAARGVALDLAL